MDSNSIELPGSEIDYIRLDDDRISVGFSRAYIIRMMTGSRERTRWWQRGEMIIEGASAEEDIPEAPLICLGGDLDDNVFTYRDMIPLPLETRGRIRCELRFKDTKERLVVSGEALSMRMADVPKYIEHIRPEDP